MQQHYALIRQAYDDFYKGLLAKGRLPLKDTGVGFWGVSAADDVFAFFRRINLDRYHHFLDLGAGDFKVAFIASLFTQASGIEYDPWLVGQAREIRTRLAHIPTVNQVGIYEGDFLQHPLHPYDVIFWHPDQQSVALDRKLSQELQGRLIVHGPHFHPQGLQKREMHTINGTLFTVY